jgi:hypothetical protein
MMKPINKSEWKLNRLLDVMIECEKEQLHRCDLADKGGFLNPLSISSSVLDHYY